MFCAACGAWCERKAVHRIAPKTKLCPSCFEELADDYPGADESRIRRLYGLRIEDHGDLYKAQGGRCAICRYNKPLVVDHDHDTGLVRGLLCAACNSGIGFFKDSKTNLAMAIVYLDR